MRPAGWESLLSHHIREAGVRPFAWGSHDCALWCADWVRKLSGKDPAADFRGKYATEEEARRLLGALGCAGNADLADRHLSRVPVAQARRGDVMLHPRGFLGICDGAYAHFVMVKGVTRVEFLRCLTAWKVD